MKPIKFGCGLIVLIVVAAIFYQSYQRALSISHLSKNHINITMHDPSTLKPIPWYSPELNANLRFPAELAPPTPQVVPQTRCAFGAFKPGDASFLVAVVELKNHTYTAEIAAAREKLLKSNNMKILGEGVADINGMHTYIFDVSMNTANPVLGRLYVIQGSDGNAYLLTSMAPASRWPSFSDIADSAASTFSLGQPSASPASPIAAAPSEPPHFSFNRPTAPAPSAPTPTPTTPDPLPPALAPSNTSRLPAGPIQVQIDGTWTRALVMESTADKTHVRYFPLGQPSQTAWVTDDQIRPLTPERMREESERRIQQMRTRHAHDASSNTSPTPRPAPTPAPAPAPAPTPEPAPAPTIQLTLDTALKLLTSPADQPKALDFLANATPDAPHRAKVISALHPLLDADKSLSLPAARALARWSDDAAERSLISQFQTTPRENRRPYFEYLTARKTPSAARALAARLHFSEDVIAAEAALESLGLIAEPPTRDLLSDKDPAVIKYAIDTLATIGTTDSLPALDKLSQNPDYKISAAASRAIQRIQSRTK
ncbi:MAG: HEAT repeat domain-containing protein [Phycisphaerae bacterium]